MLYNVKEDQSVLSFYFCFHFPSNLLPERIAKFQVTPAADTKTHHENNFLTFQDLLQWEHRAFEQTHHYRVVLVDCQDLLLYSPVPSKPPSIF